MNFDFMQLDRPANAEEALEKRVSPCIAHDGHTELEEAKLRLGKVIETVSPRVFETGGKRDSNSTKPFIHNLKGYTRQRFGYHMNKGASKYGDGNWEKGLPTSCYIESLDRHLAAYMEGDRSEDHLAAIIFNAQGCMMNEKNLENIPADHYFKTKNDN
jgi:hypothetical protein